MRFTRLIILLLLLAIPVAVYGDSYCIDCGGDGRMPGDTQVCNPGSSPSDGQVLEWSDSSQCWDAATDNTGSGGSAIVLDLGNNGADESADLNEIATTGDTNSIFTEPSADKLLIDLSNNWPTADNATTADALAANPTDCAAGEFATTIAANGDLTCAEPDWADLINVPAFRKTLVQLSPRGAALPASSFATPNSRNSIPTLRFNGNVAAFWCFVLPNTYGGNGTTVEFWVASTETSNDTDWDVAWARMEAEDLDTSNPYASAISADNNNNNATSGIPTKVSVAFTDGAQMDSCAAGEYCCVKVTRDDTADSGGADTIDYTMGAIKETP